MNEVSTKSMNAPRSDWKSQARLYATDLDVISTYSTAHLKTAYAYFYKNKNKQGFNQDACKSIDEILKNRLTGEDLKLWESQKRKLS